jgi:hypothetical protein
VPLEEVCKNDIPGPLLVRLMFSVLLLFDKALSKVNKHTRRHLCTLDEDTKSSMLLRYDNIMSLSEVIPCP